MLHQRALINELSTTQVAKGPAQAGMGTFDESRHIYTKECKQ